MPLVIALLVGAAGIALLWAGGVDFPVAVPPGLVILAVGALVVATWRSRAALWVGVFLGLFVTAGFVASCFGSGQGLDNLAGDEGMLAAVGQVVELVGVVSAAYLGLRLALRRA